LPELGKIFLKKSKVVIFNEIEMDGGFAIATIFSSENFSPTKKDEERTNPPLHP